MSWPSILILAIGAYGFKAAGVIMGSGQLGERIRPVASLVPAALFSGIIVALTLDGGNSTLVLDARIWGVAAAGILVWRRAPFVLTVLGAMLVTAAVRLIS